MKFYCISKLLDRIESQDYELLEGATMISGQPGSPIVILKNPWGTGWIFDADEDFRSWCMMLHGFDLVEITDQEFYQFRLDNRAHIEGRERASKVGDILKGQYDSIKINS